MASGIGTVVLGQIWVGSPRGSAIGAHLLLSDETKIERSQKKNEMDAPAHETHFRRLHKARSVERHSEVYLIKIDLDPAADEECTGQKFAKIPAAISEICCRRPSDYQSGNENSYVHAFSLADMRLGRRLKPAADVMGVSGPLFAKLLR
jgi:hypothetical protein